jgi:hypothetical protein
LLGPTRSPPETPSVGSIPTLPPGWRLPTVERFSPTHRQPLAPFSRTAVQAGPSRSRPPRCRYPLSCPRCTNAPGRPSRRRCLSPTSATDQFSRAPWGTHAPERRARTLPAAASGAAPFRRLASPARERSFPYTEAPNDHGGRSTSSGAALGTARASWSPCRSLPPPGPRPGLFRSARRSSRSACSALHEVADQTPDAPCRAALPTQPSVAGRACDGTKDPFHRRQANVAAFRARSAFHRRVSHASVPLLARRNVRGAATDPPALPPEVRFRHAFARLPRARSERLTGCSPGAAGPRAARRFLQLCGSPSTASGSPNPAGVAPRPKPRHRG